MTRAEFQNISRIEMNCTSETKLRSHPHTDRTSDSGTFGDHLKWEVPFARLSYPKQGQLTLISLGLSSSLAVAVLISPRGVPRQLVAGAGEGFPLSLLSQDSA